MGKQIEIFDSTLRDGAQAQGISFMLHDKIAIAQKLDALGFTFIEGGSPASNPKDAEFFGSAFQLKKSALVAFGATRRRGITADAAKNLVSLVNSSADNIAIVGKASAKQVVDVLQTTKAENLEMIEDSIVFLKKSKQLVMFDAEHFFDGYKQDKAYSLECLRAAINGGADRLVLCDTNGGCFPNEIFEIVSEVKSNFPNIKIGIHCHNDNGCAVANSIMAVKAGAEQVQGTFLGFGERCGNANLSSVIPSLQLKLGYECIPESAMRELLKTARFIAETSNIVLDSHLPYVGKSAFAHKAGMHVDGVAKEPDSFEHINPALVGNTRNIVLSEMAGRTAVLSLVGDIDPSIKKNSELAAELCEYLKELEAGGYIFESAQASLKLKLIKKLGKFKPYFKLSKFKVIGEQSSENAFDLSSAMIKIEVNSQTETTAAEGEGPVNALDLALKKAVERFYPQIATVRLTDYKVRVIEPADATAALVRVLITSTDGSDIWTTVGVSRDIIKASLLALLDSIEYKLIKK